MTATEQDRSAALKNFPILEEAGLQVKVALIPEGLDPDDFIRKHGGERFRNQIVDGAVTTTKFKLINLKKAIYC